MESLLYTKVSDGFVQLLTTNHPDEANYTKLYTMRKKYQNRLRCPSFFYGLMLFDLMSIATRSHPLS